MAPTPPAFGAPRDTRGAPRAPTWPPRPNLLPNRSADVRRDPEGVVEPVRKVGDRDHQRELDDLLLVEVLPQILQRRVANHRRAPGHAVGVEDDRFLALVEQGTAL